jgi:hypothetical protein
MTYEDKKRYDCSIIGVRHVRIGQNQTQGLEFAIRMEDGKQDSVTKFLTPKAMDLTGSGWLRKINRALSDKPAVAIAEDNGKYGVRLAALYAPNQGPQIEEVGSSPSPFDAVVDESVPF